MTDAAPATPLDTSAAPVTPSAAAPSAPATPAAPSSKEPPAPSKDAIQGTAPTIGSDEPAGDGDLPSDGDSDWRKEFTGGDEKLMKRISRYASPAGLVKALVAAQDKIQEKTSGGPLPDNATDEQKAEWRKAQGIPDKAEAYQLPKVSGYDWSDEDRSAFSVFTPAFHEANLSQAQADKITQAFAVSKAEAAAKQFETDTASRATLEDELRTEWGPEYRSNIKMLARYAEKIPGAGAGILEARLPDGRRLGEVPEFVKDLVERARDHYGDSSFIAGDGGSAIANRKAEIEAVMKADMNKYRSSGMAAEYRKILEAEERSKR